MRHASCCGDLSKRRGGERKDRARGALPQAAALQSWDCFVAARKSGIQNSRTTNNSVFTSIFRIFEL
jgi:hypothetical protein